MPGHRQPSPGAERRGEADEGGKRWHPEQTKAFVSYCAPGQKSGRDSGSDSGPEPNAK